MRALNLYGINQLVYDEVAYPERKPDEVIVKVMAAGICGSDISRVFEKGTYHFPTIIGHEFAGQIVETDEKNFIGQRVAVFPLVPCGKCSACQCGKYAQCEQYNYYGSRCDGGMSEYIAVKKENLVMVPDGVTYQEAAMCEPASVALQAFKKSGAGIGSTVVIFGIGPIGIMIAQWAKASGVKNIVLVARSSEKVEFVKNLGFEHAINLQQQDVTEYVLALTDGLGADVCIEGTGTSETLEKSLFVIRNFGRVITLGNPSKEMALSQKAYWNILRKEISILGTWNSSFNAMENDWQDSLQAMKDKKLQVLPLITHEFAMKDHQKAFSIMHEKKELYCKIMFSTEK